MVTKTATVPPPYLVSWNITKRCNLKCAHCYLEASEFEGAGDISTDEAKGFVEEITSLNPAAMLILTGGEPLLRPDFFDIAGHASKKGLTVFVGTNGTLLDYATVERMTRSGVKGVGVSLDSTAPGYHDRFRGKEGSWHESVEGIKNLRRAGLDFQVQFTVTRENREELPGLIELSRDLGARAVNVFFLVCTGRGQDSTDLSSAEYEETLDYLLEAEKTHRGNIIVRARCAPHFLRVAEQKDPENPLLKGATSGCIAGRTYLRISPEGFVSPCPYIPVDKNSPSLKTRRLREIWEGDGVFYSLRNPEYRGRCRECEYTTLCGGCRARALTKGDLFGEDPWCGHEPGKGPEAKKEIKTEKPQWTKEALARLERVPPFLKEMVASGVERYAMSKGIKEITPEVMGEMRKTFN